MALGGKSYVPSVNFFGALSDIGDVIAQGRAAAEQEAKDQALLGGAAYTPPASFVDRLVGAISPKKPAEVEGAVTPTSSGAPSPAAPSNEVTAYIRQAAAARGIDPEVAVKVAASEGLRGYVGDENSSFGPFQLHYGGVAPGGNRVPGLGDEFTKTTGLDARDPGTWKQQVDFSLDQAAKGGWGPWHGAAKVGIGERQGIGGAPVQIADASGRIPIGGAALPSAPPESAAARLLKTFPPGLQTPEGIMRAMTTGSPHVRAIAEKALSIYTQAAQKQNTVSTVSDPEELRALGVPSDFKGIVQRDASGKLHVQKFGPETQVNIDNKGESAQAQELGKLNAKSIDELRKAADDAPAQISKLNLLGKMLDDVETGALAPAQANIARYGKAFGLSDEVVKEFLHADPRLPATQQAATKLINEMTVGMIGQGKFPANNFSDADRRFITDIFPNIANEPEANKLAVEVQKRMQQRMVEKAEAWDRYSEWQERVGKQPSYEKFDREFRKDVQKRDLFSDIAVNKPKKEWTQPKLGSVPIPPADARALQAHPELRDKFDQTYGAGAADRVLGPRL